MHIHLSQNSGVPIYRQIVEQVQYLIAAGRLAPGQELPSIRVLAQKLIVNPNTVARAYRELEVAGVVSKRNTSGTYVSDEGSPLAKRERRKILHKHIDKLLAEAHQMAFDLTDVLQMVHERASSIWPEESVKEKA